jgi:hypothetical protein
MNILFTNLCHHLEVLAEERIQRKVWLNENNDTGEISSFTELYLGIMYDCALDEILKNQDYWGGVPSAVIEELERLGIELKCFKDRVSHILSRETPEDLESIMQNPDWIKISQHAKKILEMWI